MVVEDIPWRELVRFLLTHAPCLTYRLQASYRTDDTTTKLAERAAQTVKVTFMTGKFALDLTLEGKEKETREEEVRKEVEKAIAYTLDYSSHPTKPGETAPFMYAKWRPDGRVVRLPRCSLFLCPPSFARASCAATGSWRPCPSSTSIRRRPSPPTAHGVFQMHLPPVRLL